MARKDRAPDPPKRPQGPQRRSTPRSAEADARRRRTLLLVGGAAALAAAIVAGLLLLAGGGGDDGGRAALEKAGCTLEVAPAQEGEHSVVELTATSNPKWNTDPPTSGPHNDQPAVYGFYEEPVPLAQTIHNLEHGAIVVHFGDKVPEAEIERLRAWYTDDPNGIVVARLDKLGNRIALSAWTTDEALTGDEAGSGEGYLAKCPRFDEEAFSTFRDEHRYQGPERFPEDALHPGNS